MKPVLILLMPFLCVFTTAGTLLAGGTGGNGGGWFIKPLPILKFQLPENEGVSGGVRYKRIRVPRCGPMQMPNVPMLPNRESYLPGKNWEAYKVIMYGSSVVCSLGISEKNSDEALNLLLSGEPSSTEVGIFGEKLYDKSLGGVLVKGPFLVIPKDEKFSLFSLQSTNYKMKPYWPRPASESAVGDDVYIPIGVEKSQNVYFGYLSYSWNIFLPLDVKPTDLPLAKVSQVMDAASETEIIPLWRITDSIPHPDVFNTTFDKPAWAEEWIQNAIWNDNWQTPTAIALRTKLASQLGFKLDDWVYNSTLQNKVMFNLVPTILETDISHPHYHAPGKARVEITLPVGIPKWRVSGDLVHEMTHMLQSPVTREMTDEEILKTEMEAHLAERQHIAELTRQFPILSFSVPSFNFIVAAHMPLGQWSAAVSESKSLCQNIIDDYKLNLKKITEEALISLGCVRRSP